MGNEKNDNGYENPGLYKLRNIGRIVLDAFYPPACVVCGKPLGEHTGAGVHDTCRRQLKPVEEPVCVKCGKHLQTEEIMCDDCKRYEHVFDQAVSVFEYNDAIKKGIYRFKYKNKREYASTFAAAIAEGAGRLIKMWDPDVIVPVPMHEKKKRVRGYDQAELLAKKTGELLDIPVDSDFLVRTRKTAPMKEVDKKGRRDNVKDAFEAEIGDGEEVYKSVLLVDDIITTGFTLDECAKVLKETGVKEVKALTLCSGEGF